MITKSEKIIGGWEHFQHEADMGIRGYGRSIEEAFEQTGKALTAVITDLALVNSQQKISLECDAPDIELLLTEWLNTLIYEMATRRMLFSSFKVRIENNNLHAEVGGEPVDVKKHEPAVEVKGATYTALSVKQFPDGLWYAQCVVDV